MTILPAYAAVLALLFVFLSAQTIRARRSLGIGLGHGDNPAMLRAIRVHANFAEYVPLALLLIFFVELSGAQAWLVHSLCAALVAARLSHAWGVGREPGNMRLRVLGMVLTFTVMLVSACHILVMRLAL